MDLHGAPCSRIGLHWPQHHWRRLSPGRPRGAVAHLRHIFRGRVWGPGRLPRFTAPSAPRPWPL
eukprot:10855841-Lingulodinium_polyedra.AAC.1